MVFETLFEKRFQFHTYSKQRVQAQNELDRDMEAVMHYQSRLSQMEGESMKAGAYETCDSRSFCHASVQIFARKVDWWKQIIDAYDTHVSLQEDFGSFSKFVQFVLKRIDALQVMFQRMFDVTIDITDWNANLDNIFDPEEHLDEWNSALLTDSVVTIEEWIASRHSI